MHKVRSYYQIRSYYQLWITLSLGFQADLASSPRPTITACRHWVESVNWVIFDEVHCISELGGGDIWERLLLSVR